MLDNDPKRDYNVTEDEKGGHQMRRYLIMERERQGFTQQQLASAVGISRSHYAQIEQGSKSPSYKISLRIKRILCHPGDDIFLSKMTQKRTKGKEDDPKREMSKSSLKLYKEKEGGINAKTSNKSPWKPVLSSPFASRKVQRPVRNQGNGSRRTAGGVRRLLEKVRAGHNQTAEYGSRPHGGRL